MNLLQRMHASAGITGTSENSADAWTQEADAIALPRLDEVDGHVRPTNMGNTYAEHEYDAQADEQEASWSAESERAARPFQVHARGRDTSADANLFLLQQHEEEVRAAHKDHQHAARVLQPYVRREPGAKLRYWVVWMLLALGDAAGVLAAAIVLGEVPVVAAGQALSSGLAAACAGLIGAELKHLQLARARERDTEKLSEDEQRYRRLFSGPAGIGTVRLVAGLSFLVVLLMAIAVFALRTSVEGSAAGLTFGLLAAVTALGSALLSYASADEVADLLATTAKRVRRAEKHHQALASTGAIRSRSETDEAARSLHTEGQHRGQAARRRMGALGWRVQRRNPQVLGHGFPAGEQTGIVGRRLRNGAPG